MVACGLLNYLGSAATWYASSDGSTTNGTYSNPWGILFAVTNTNPHLVAGDTVVLKSGGTWTCTESNATFASGPVLEFRKSGSPSSKITYRAESLWGFSFDGGLMFEIASNVVIRDCRIFYSAATNRWKLVRGTFPSGIEEMTEGNEFLHNLIENTYHGFGSWKTTRGKNISGNVIRFQGMFDYVDYTGADRGGGAYMQNADNSSEALISGNISYFNLTTGMGASGNTDIWGFKFINNIMAITTQGGVWYQQDDYGSQGLQVLSNYMWQCNSCIKLGYIGQGPHTNAVILGNECVDYGYPIYMVDGWTNCTVSNNVFVNLTNRYTFFLERSGETDAYLASHHIDNNEYWTTNTGGIGAGPFLVEETSTSFADWKTTVLGDSNSTFAYAFPTTVQSYCFRPTSDSNFVHAAVFNWPTNETASIDLSPYFQSGNTLSIYDAQEIPTAYSNLTYSGGAINVDLARTNKASMLGTFTNLAYVWSGFDPRFRAFVIHRNGSVSKRLNSGRSNVGSLKGKP